MADNYQYIILELQFINILRDMYYENGHLSLKKDHVSNKLCRVSTKTGIDIDKVLDSEALT